MFARYWSVNQVNLVPVILLIHLMGFGIDDLRLNHATLGADGFERVSLRNQFTKPGVYTSVRLFFAISGDSEWSREQAQWL